MREMKGTEDGERLREMRGTVGKGSEVRLREMRGKEVKET